MGWFGAEINVFFYKDSEIALHRNILLMGILTRMASPAAYLDMTTTHNAIAERIRCT